MISNFADNSVLDRVLKFNYISEAGLDNLGVSRDAYQSFWDTFLEFSAKGENERVPLLRPDYDDRVWHSIGRILLKGYLDLGYWPLSLSRVYVTAMTLGESHVQPQQLIDGLFDFLSDHYKQICECILTNETLDKDSLLEFLEMSNCKGEFAKGRQLLLQISHNVLIQESHYALERMSSIFAQKEPIFQNAADITNMYALKAPTIPKVIKLLQFVEPISIAERTTQQYLRDYVRSLNPQTLKAFLKFCTGSSVICVDGIKVMYFKEYGFKQHVMARTCTCLLQVPSTYMSYPMFRAEFNKILNASEGFDFA
jgi:hypothetical protein